MIIEFKTSDNKSRIEINLDQEGKDKLLKQLLYEHRSGEYMMVKTKEFEDLEKFKEDFKKLDMQKIGALMELKWGESVHDKIETWMEKMLCREDEYKSKLEAKDIALDKYGKVFDALNDLFSKIITLKN